MEKMRVLVTFALLFLASSATLDVAPRPHVKTPSDDFPAWVSAADVAQLQSPLATSSANLTVAQDGTGHFRTINEALHAASNKSRMERLTIHVKEGTYPENVVIPSNLINILLVGDGIGRTIITGDRSARGGYRTFDTATVAVVGEGFMARDITFQNTAGPENYQAVALRSDSKHSVFYLCSFEGFQDTLYARFHKQFYKECHVFGTIDFIFGRGTVLMQDCAIYARRPIKGQSNTITAQGRSRCWRRTGTVVQRARVLAADDLRPVLESVKTFLGRPWGRCSRTVFMETFLDSLIDPAGWSEWDGNFALDTLYYGEYNNTGPGSSTSGRVKWPGYRVITSQSEASQFTVENFLAGESWLPSTGVPFAPGL